MALNRRKFLSSSCASASALMVLEGTAAFGLGLSLSDQEIAKIIANYLHVGTEHQELIDAFILDLRSAKDSTEGLEETSKILSGARGRDEAERYIVQEFVRYSNYRMWLRRQDQALQAAPLDLTDGYGSD